MTTTSNHIDQKTIERYVAGQLSPEAAEAILAHLEQCDVCIEQVEALWAKTEMRAAVSHLSERPNEDHARRMEALLVNRIHRANFSGKLVEIGLGGFMDVVIALLRPLMGAPIRKKARGEGYD